MNRRGRLGSAALVLTLACSGCSGSAAVPKSATSSPTGLAHTALPIRPQVGGSAIPTALLPGILAISLSLSAIQSVALPMVQDFGWTKEIEDRLLAPVPTRVRPWCSRRWLLADQSSPPLPGA